MQEMIHRVRGVSLRDVLPEGYIFGTGDIRITSCCADSRQCQSGDLFVALVGNDEDGHEYASQAVDQGATAVLAERPLPLEVPTCIVRDTREAFGRVCQALAGDPSRQLRVIGVTGTSGKTTTSLLLSGVLEAAGHRVGIMGNMGYCDSVDTIHSDRPTPSAPELATWLARMGANGCSHAVVELSSIGLARRQAAGIQFDAALLTNVRRHRLDYHGSVVNYRKAKSKLFQQLQPHGVAVVNEDDPVSKNLLSKLEHPVLTIGMKSPATVTASVLERHVSEQTFLISAGNETVPVRTRMIGDHHVYNCLSAAAMGLVYGIDLPTIVRGLESVTAVPRRLERIECGQPYAVFVDSAHTPDAIVNSLLTMRNVTRGKLICVFGAAGDQDHDNRPLLGRAVEKIANLGIITNDNPRTEAPMSIIHDVLDGYDLPSRAHVMPNRAKAICWALSQAEKGDTVLITGESPCHSLAGDGHRYLVDDSDVARQWLYDSAKSHPGGPWLAPLARG